MKELINAEPLAKIDYVVSSSLRYVFLLDFARPSLSLTIGQPIISIP